MHAAWYWVFGGADSIGLGGTCPLLLQMAGHGGTVSRGTANKKLTKLYWPSRKHSPKRLVTTIVEPKIWRGEIKIFSGASRRMYTCAPSTFKFVPAPLTVFTVMAGPGADINQQRFIRKFWLGADLELLGCRGSRNRHTSLTSTRQIALSLFSSFKPSAQLK